MKIDIKDDHVMGLSMAASGAYGIHWLGFPAKAQDFNYPAAEPRSNTTARWLGLSLLQQTALTFAASQAGVNKKDMMTAMGACWGAAAAHSAYNTHKKYQKKDEGWGNTAVQAGMAGLLLWRGLRKEDK